MLAGFARRRTLLAFDYDGTLAPIAPDRRRAGLRPTTAWLLARVASRWPTAVISGRSRTDLRRRLRGSSVSWLVGNHGLEARFGSSRAIARRAREGRWAARLARELHGIGGIEVENKGASLSVHYRAARSGARARRAVERAVQTLHGARVLSGKKVVNVLPEGAPDKGDALAELVRRGRFQGVLFVGDDVTDEAVFRRAFPVPMVAVRVGRSRRSSASYYLPDQRSVDSLLRALSSFRPAAVAGRSLRPPRRKRRRQAASSAVPKRSR